MALRAAAGTFIKGARSVRHPSVVVSRTGEVFVPMICASCAPSPFVSRLFSTKGTDELLRAAVKCGVEAGLSDALKKLKSDVGPVVRLTVVQEAVNAGVTAALKDSNLSLEPVLPGCHKLMIENAAQDSLESATLKLMIEQAVQKALKLGLERSSKCQDFVCNPKLADAMDNFSGTMKDFMRVYENMFTAEEGTKAGGETDVGRSDIAKTAKDGGEGASEGGEYGGKSRKELSKFDIYLKKYNEDQLETVRVLKELLQSTEAVKQNQIKSKDFVVEWCNTAADTCLGKVRAEKLRKAITALPYFGKGYFYYLVLKMMGESQIPPWHYPMVIRAARLLLVKEAIDLYNKSKNPEDKDGEKKPEDKDDGPKPSE